MRRNKLSVGVHVDVLDRSRRDAIEAAMAGIDMVNDIANNLKVSRRRGVVALGSSAVIRANKVELPEFRTDLNIIMTSRRVFAYSRRDIGFAFAADGVALVNTETDRPDLVVAHELGHLLYVKEASPDQHCTMAECLMQPEPEIEQPDFCHDCVDELGRKAFHLSDYHAGNALALQWLQS